MEKNLEKYITELLYCLPETNTLSEINCTSIKQKPTVRYPYTYTIRVKTNKQKKHLRIQSVDEDEEQLESSYTAVRA